MFLYKVRSIQQLSNNSILNKLLKRPESLLEKLNEEILKKPNKYCQTVLLTSENWGDVLGVAYQDSPNSGNI